MVVFKEISKNEKQTREIKLKYNAAKANFSCFPLWGEWLEEPREVVRRRGEVSAEQAVVDLLFLHKWNISQNFHN